MPLPYLANEDHIKAFASVFKNPTSLLCGFFNVHLKHMTSKSLKRPPGINYCPDEREISWKCAVLCHHGARQNNKMLPRSNRAVLTTTPPTEIEHRCRNRTTICDVLETLWPAATRREERSCHHRSDKGYHTLAACCQLNNWQLYETSGPNKFKI